MSIDEQVDYLCDVRMFSKYYSGNELYGWQPQTFSGGGKMHLYKARVKELLLAGKKVKTGYRTSKMVRGYKTYYIFYK